MQKLIILIFLLGLVNKEGHSQTEILSDSSVINRMLINLDQLITRNLDSALFLSKEINQEANTINYQHGIWETMLHQGKIYKDLGCQDSSLLILNQVLNQSIQQDERLIQIKAHLELASTFQQNYNFNSAVTHLIQAEKLLKNTDSFNLRYRILNNLGAVHRKMKDYKNALKYFSILEENYFYQLDTEQKFYLYMNRGNIFADQKNYTKTEELFNKAYAEIIKIDHPSNLAVITYNLGTLYYRQKRFKEAEDYISESLNATLKIGNQTKIERCYRVLGAINMDQGNYQKAEDYYFKALRIAKEIDNPKSILGNYKNLYINYAFLEEATGNTDYLKKQLNYYKKWANLNDSLYQIETAEKILELEKQYETEKKNNQIAILEKENQLQEDKIYIQRSQQNYLIVFMILITGILGIFIYFFYYHKKVNRLLQKQGKRILSQKNQISDQNKKLQKSLNTQNKLFSIIAHDLRSPLVSISNFSKLIGFYVQDKKYDSLNDIAKLMDKKNDHVLELTDNLLSWAKSQTESLRPLYEPISIKKTIDECLELYHPIAKEKDITISYANQEELLLWADNNMVKTICRNLINNAIKFTQKKGVIKVYYENNNPSAHIYIIDSGVGISKEKLEILFKVDQEKVIQGTEGEKSSGLGLAVCKEFIDSMDGKIWVESQTGQGSKFCFELSLFDPNIHQAKYKQSAKTKLETIQNFL